MPRLVRIDKSGSTIQKLLAFGSLIIMIAFFSLMKPSFLTFDNIMSVILATCVNGVLALGVTFVIITGGIDLSVGTVMTFSSIMAGLAISIFHLPIIIGVLIGLLTGSLCGFINGFVVSKMKLPPFIATLGMMMATKGMSLVLSGARPVYFSSAPLYRKIALGSILGIPKLYNAILIYMFMAIVADIILSRTLLGRYTFGIGSNEEAARLSGISVDTWKIVIYTICGLFCAVAGIIISSRLDSAQPALGPGYELEAIAAAVIGGTSLSGGEGSILGTVIGAFIMSVLTNGLRIMSVPQEWQSVAIGVVLVFAVYLDIIRKNRDFSR
ncbi:ABC transporter permease [Thermoanaerobacteraceae bacterium SP2]|nr:ABC transporter permease [Thermoanaerobacteraceae bacterium SP2]